MQQPKPIDPNLWTNEAQPQLIGGKLPGGKIVFPMPEGDAAAEVEQFLLSRVGTLWSWTSQEFRPKSPYDGPENFEPFLIGYVELPGEVIVETRIVNTTLDQLEIGTPMALTIVPFDTDRTIYAFQPESAQ